MNLLQNGAEGVGKLINVRLGPLSPRFRIGNELDSDRRWHGIQMLADDSDQATASAASVERTVRSRLLAPTERTAQRRFAAVHG